MTEESMTEESTTAKAPKPPWLGVLGLAVIHGLIATFGLTLARWLTSSPYSSAIIRWDVLFAVLGFTVVYAGARLVLPAPSRGSRPGLQSAAPSGLRGWSFVTTAAAGLYLTSVWATHLADSPGLARTIGWGLILVAAGFLARNAVTRRTSRITVEWLMILVGPTIALGPILATTSVIPWLIFPLLLAALLFAGQPRSEPRLSGRLAGPILAQGGLIALCSLSVFPWSPERLALSGEDTGREVPEGASSVVMIVADNLRRDHLSLYGYERLTTPLIDRWAEDGLVFEDVSSASCWTLPSHASLFTGLYPRSHGAHSYRGDAQWANAYALPKEETTLAEVASRAGIATAAIISNSVFLAPRFGLAQGFDDYWAEAPQHKIYYPPSDFLARVFDLAEYAESRWSYYRGRAMTDNAIRWIQSAGDGQFFLFLNYMDVHQPNWRPPNEAVPHFEGEETFVDPGATQGAGLFLERRSLPPDVRTYRVNHFDRELFILDQELDRLFRFLEDSGLSESTAVILTSDHGEYFGEHGMTGHSGHLHREVVDIPLVIRGPGVPAGRTSRPTHLIDLFGAALDLLGVEHDDPRIFSALDDEPRPSIVSEWYASDSALLMQPRMQGRFERDIRALKLGGLKLFEDSHGHVELYDLDSPGGESVDVTASRPEEVERLQAYLGEWKVENPASDRVTRPEEKTLDAEEAERLRALGYLH